MPADLVDRLPESHILQRDRNSLLGILSRADDADGIARLIGDGPKNIRDGLVLGDQSNARGLPRLALAQVLQNGAGPKALLQVRTVGDGLECLPRRAAELDQLLLGRFPPAKVSRGKVRDQLLNLLGARRCFGFPQRGGGQCQDGADLEHPDPKTAIDFSVAETHSDTVTKRAGMDNAAKPPIARKNRFRGAESVVFPIRGK